MHYYNVYSSDARQKTLHVYVTFHVPKCPQLADEFIIMEKHQVPKKSTITNLFLFLAANIMAKIVIGVTVIICSA